MKNNKSTNRPVAPTEGRRPKGRRSGVASQRSQSKSAEIAAPQKLHKLLAQAGLASRREANRWLEEGRLTVNGRLAEPAIRVTGQEEIRLDSVLLRLPDMSRQSSRILLYNKPAGEICTHKDPQGRLLVFDQLPPLQKGRWLSVGRLDINTTGLLLFSNDGDFVHRFMHPAAGFDREYAVRVFGKVNETMLARLREGVTLEDGLARFSDLQLYGGTGINRWYHVTLMSGRKNEVRRLWESQGVTVSRLKRVRFGPVVAPSVLRLGQCLELSSAEVMALYQLVGLQPKLASMGKSSVRKAVQASKVLIPYPGMIGNR